MAAEGLFRLRWRGTELCRAPALQAQALAICAQAAGELRERLPTLPPTVRVWLGTRGRGIAEYGFGARALDPTTLEVTLLSGHTLEPAERLRRYLRPALYHECHHLLRGWVLRGGRRRRYLLEAAVCEGLASVFEREAGGEPPPWSRYPAQVSTWVDELRGRPLGRDYAQWMFRHPDGRRWIGYRVGTWIAERAIIASGASAAQLALCDDAEVLRLAAVGGPD